MVKKILINTGLTQTCDLRSVFLDVRLESCPILIVYDLFETVVRRRFPSISRRRLESYTVLIGHRDKLTFGKNLRSKLRLIDMKFRIQSGRTENAIRFQLKTNRFLAFENTIYRLFRPVEFKIWGFGVRSYYDNWSYMHSAD